MTRLSSMAASIQRFRFHPSACDSAYSTVHKLGSIHLNLYVEDTATPGEARVGTPGPTMYQVGSEGGFLPAVAIHDNTRPIPLVNADDETTANPDGPFNLLLAPAERADVVIDFNGAPRAPVSFCTTTHLRRSLAEIPGNDYFTGARIRPPAVAHLPLR